MFPAHAGLHKYIRYYKMDGRNVGRSDGSNYISYN